MLGICFFKLNTAYIIFLGLCLRNSFKTMCNMHIHSCSSYNSLVFIRYVHLVDNKCSIHVITHEHYLICNWF